MKRFNSSLAPTLGFHIHSSQAMEVVEFIGDANLVSVSCFGSKPVPSIVNMSQSLCQCVRGQAAALLLFTNFQTFQHLRLRVRFFWGCGSFLLASTAKAKGKDPDKAMVDVCRASLRAVWLPGFATWVCLVTLVLLCYGHVTFAFAF